MKKGYAKLLLPIVAMAVVFAGANASVYSARKDADVEFESAPTLTITLSSDDVAIENLIPGTADDSNEISVTVSTNSDSGYLLNAAIGTKENVTNSLLLVDEGDDLFESIAVGVPVTEITQARTWGFSTDHGATYSGMPTIIDTEHIETISSTTEPAIDEIPFLIGARADRFQTPGEYRNIVTFTATANPVPDTIATVRYMQDINDDVYASMEMEQQYQLIDKRDNKKYWIAKLADGNVWMTQNLSFELAAPSVTLYPETSNVSTTTTIPFREWREVNQVNFDSANRSGVSPIGVFLSSIESNAYIPGGVLANEGRVTATTLASTEDLAADDENWHYQVGTLVTSGIANSICPKGWMAPDDNPQYDMNVIVNRYGFASSPAYLITTPIDTTSSTIGYEMGSGAGIRYWAKDGMVSRPVNEHAGFYSGSFAAVRCVARRTSEYLYRFFMNDGTDDLFYSYVSGSWGGQDVSVIAPDYTFVYKQEYNEDLVLDRITRFNYVFDGWSSDPDATTAEYKAGDPLLTDTSGQNDFYAVWKPVDVTLEDAFAAAGATKVDGEHYAMQDMTVEICSAASINSSTDLIDTRDSKIYKVAKFKRAMEGAASTCWMIENLRLGDAENETILSSDDTDLPSGTTFTLPVATTDSISNDSRVSQYAIDDSVDAQGRHYGYKYNYYAAKAGLIVNTDIDVSNQSLCPKGWTLPTENRGFGELLKAYALGDQYGWGYSPSTHTYSPETISITLKSFDLMEDRDTRYWYGDNEMYSYYYNSRYRDAIRVNVFPTGDYVYYHSGGVTYNDNPASIRCTLRVNH